MAIKPKSGSVSTPPKCGALETRGRSLRCFCRSRCEGPIVGLYDGKEICQRHASLLKPGQVTPLPKVEDLKVKNSSVVAAAREANVIMGAFPTGEYDDVRRLLKEGEAEAALTLAYRFGTETLVGLTRGRIHDQIRTENEQRATVDTTIELENLFLEAEELRRQISANPEVAFGAALRYLEGLGLRFQVVVPARALIYHARQLKGEVTDLSFDDLEDEIREIMTKLEGFVQEPANVDPLDLQQIDDRLWGISERARSLRLTLQQVAAEGEARHGHTKMTRSQRRRRRKGIDQGWRGRIRGDGSGGRSLGDAVPIGSAG